MIAKTLDERFEIFSRELDLIDARLNKLEGREGRHVSVGHRAPLTGLKKAGVIEGS